MRQTRCSCSQARTDCEREKLDAISVCRERTEEIRRWSVQIEHCVGVPLAFRSLPGGGHQDADKKMSPTDLLAAGACQLERLTVPWFTWATKKCCWRCTRLLHFGTAALGEAQNSVSCNNRHKMISKASACPHDVWRDVVVGVHGSGPSHCRPLGPRGSDSTTAVSK